MKWKNTIPKQVEQSIYKQIRDEIKKKNLDDACYMKDLSKANGDEKKATGYYIEIRFSELWETYVDEAERLFRENKENLKWKTKIYKDKILKEQHDLVLKKHNHIIKLIKGDIVFIKLSAEYQDQLLDIINDVFNLPDAAGNRIKLTKSMDFLKLFLSKYNRGKTIANSITMKDFGVKK